MTYLALPVRKRTSALVGWVAMCWVGACGPSQTATGDAATAPAGNDASSALSPGDAPPTAPGDDAPWSPAGGDASSPLSVENFPTTFARAVCPAIAACCQQAGFDSSSCPTILEAVVRKWVTDRTSDPNVVLDLIAAARCIEVTRAAFAACTDRDLANPSSNVCGQMTHGTVPIGGGCTDGKQCLPQTGLPVECDAGVCRVAPPQPVNNPRGTLGDFCAGTCRPSGCSSSGSGPLALCWTDDNLYCPDGLNPRICSVAPTVGQPCSRFCAQGAHCADDGVCAPNLTTGLCRSPDDCAAGAYCAPTAEAFTGQCTLLKENGVACTAARECASGQCLGATCRPWSMANDVVCSGVIF